MPMSYSRPRRKSVSNAARYRGGAWAKNIRLSTPIRRRARASILGMRPKPVYRPRLRRPPRKSY